MLLQLSLDERMWAMETGGKWHNLIDNSRRLYLNGYKYVNLFDDVYKVISPKGETYTVDVRDRTCTCPAFVNGMFKMNSGATVCKHCVGIYCLVCDQDHAAYCNKMGWKK